MGKSAWDTVIEPHMEDILQWAHDGFTTTEICHKLGLSTQTFYRHFKLHGDEWSAYTNAQVDPDREVEAALYKIATGCTIHKITTETTWDGQGNVISKKERDVAEQIPPNPQAVSFWLYNRKRDVWQKDPRPKMEENGDSGVIMMPEVTDG